MKRGKEKGNGSFTYSLKEGDIMYAAYPYELSDHVLRLKKEEHKKAWKDRLQADRRPPTKRRRLAWERRHEDRVSDFLSVRFALQMAEEMS